MTKGVYHLTKSFVDYCIGRVKDLFKYLINTSTSLQSNENSDPVITNPSANLETKVNLINQPCEFNLTPDKRVIPMCISFENASANQQAEQILNYALNLLDKQPELPGIGLTYSANHEQTLKIINCYENGDSETEINGANQANVVYMVEQFLLHHKKYKTLQNKFRIVPISTMNYNTQGTKIPCTDQEFDVCIRNILDLFKKQWCILGWQNQTTINNKEQPYAIGGGVARDVTPKQHTDKIQKLLKESAISLA